MHPIAAVMHTSICIPVLLLLTTMKSTPAPMNFATVVIFLIMLVQLKHVPYTGTKKTKQCLHVGEQLFLNMDSCSSVGLQGRDGMYTQWPNQCYVCSRHCLVMTKGCSI